MRARQGFARVVAQLIRNGVIAVQSASVGKGVAVGEEKTLRRIYGEYRHIAPIPCPLLEVTRLVVGQGKRCPVLS
jgi:hypothetical protein